MPALIDAVLPAQPFPNPVPLPVSKPGDGDQFCIHLNREWIPYIMACLLPLLADSTWDSDDENSVATVEQNAYTLIQQLNQPEACPMPVMFQLKPTDAHFWQYSNDGGVTWHDQPDTVTPFVPSFRVSGAGSGFDESVNGGLSWGGVPAMTAQTANDAIITDPTSLLRNLIVLAAGGPEALIAEVGTQLVMNFITQGITALFAKNMQVPAFASDPVVRIDGLGSGAPLLQVNP